MSEKKLQPYIQLPTESEVESGTGESTMWQDSDVALAIETGHLCQRPDKRARFWANVMLIVQIGILILAFLMIYGIWDLLASLKAQMSSHSLKHPTTASLTENGCFEPSVRPSWNRMEEHEKQLYLNAVLCMAEKPSYLHPNTSMYDDFTHVHINDGNIIHFAAANLPWHRLHLHAWEQALRRECGYPGSLPYWEWELEDSDPFHSHIFDATVGFGGDGDQTAGHLADDDYSAFSLDETRCLQDGPFKNVLVHWFAELPGNRALKLEYHPHCITRSFTDNFQDPSIAPAWDAHWDFGTRRVAEVMEMDDFHEFGLAAEELHNWLPRSLRGEFASLAGPNDPIFYLHLSNIDRIWWKWQQCDSRVRLMAYYGEAEHNRGVNASLDDPLAFAALPGIQPVSVRDMMSTQSGALASEDTRCGIPMAFVQRFELCSR